MCSLILVSNKFLLWAFRNVSGGLSPRHNSVGPKQDYGQISSPHISQRFSNPPVRAFSSNHADVLDRDGGTGRLESPVRSPRRALTADQAFSNFFRVGVFNLVWMMVCVICFCALPMSVSCLCVLVHEQPQKSPEHSPAPSPRGRSPVPSAAVSPLHPKAIVSGIQDSGRHESIAHPLPLPPSTTNSSYTSATSTYSTIPRSPGRSVNLQTGWRKGSLLGSGTFGHVYTGFHRCFALSCVAHVFLSLLSEVVRVVSFGW